MRRLFTALTILLFTMTAYGQQTAMYTQYMFNTLPVNPAYAAEDESMTITALSRHQWVGFKGAPRTQTLSVHSPVGESNTFLGGTLIDDQIGEVLRESGGYATLTQRVEVGDGAFLAVGINGGVSSFKADYAQNYAYSPESVNDPKFFNSSAMRGNFGAGVMFFTEKYYLGLSSPHFLSRNFSSYDGNSSAPPVKPYFIFQSGALFDINLDYKFKPNALIKYVNGSPMQIDLNANFLIKEVLWLGASYRSFDSFDASASVFITQDIQLGYSYDFASTQLSQTQKGSHEVMLKFRFAVRGREHVRCYF